MDEENQMTDILQVMAEFMTAFLNDHFPEREGMAIELKKKKLIAYVPTEDKKDTSVVRATKIDDSTVSIVLYRATNPDLKLYMDYFNRVCDNVERNTAKLSKISVDLLLNIAGNDAPKEQTNAKPDHFINVENIVRVTSVETVDIMEQHVLAVSFDGQPPINLSVAKEQLKCFTIGNKMAKMPFGFQLIEQNSTLH